MVQFGTLYIFNFSSWITVPGMVFMVSCQLNLIEQSVNLMTVFNSLKMMFLYLVYTIIVKCKLAIGIPVLFNILNMIW